MCIVSGFVGAFFAMACGATGGKSANANDVSDTGVDDGGDDGEEAIEPIDDIILTKRVEECSWNAYYARTCHAYQFLDGDEVWSMTFMKSGQPSETCVENADCDTVQIVIIE